MSVEHGSKDLRRQAQTGRRPLAREDSPHRGAEGLKSQPAHPRIATSVRTASPLAPPEGLPPGGHSATGGGSALDAVALEACRTRTAGLVIGVDVGSTTVKGVVVDPRTHEILWSDYRRHHTKQPEAVLELLQRIALAFPRVAQEETRIFVTGSGALPVAEPLGAKFVQEVNALTMAVEERHPDVGSVVELGGQDAKIIQFKVNRSTGEKHIQTSMNDKCASGTGATIDKCVIKVGVENAALTALHFDPERLHPVAAKCGVFAEIDVVNLVKSGIPKPEVLCSLADAVVRQNLSVLTRGNTLRHKVLLLGGPNHYLPFLQECWRKRIPETWRERGYEYPLAESLEDLIFVPPSALLYAAYGTVLYGLHESEDVGRYRGMEPLEEFVQRGRQAKFSLTAGPPLVETESELAAFRAEYTIPPFVNPPLTAGSTVRVALGIDGGSTSSKAVLLDEQGAILKKEYQLSKGNPIQDVKEMLARLADHGREKQVHWDIFAFGATGYAAAVLEKTLHADVSIVETIAHMKSATQHFGNIDVICDIGGQDIKVLFLQRGELRNFRLSNQCSAGNGMLLQAMAAEVSVPVAEFAEYAFRARLSPKFSYGCAVFLDSDRVNFQKEGFSKEELMAGLALVLPKNIWQYVVQIPRMAELGTRFVLQGGTQYNLAAVKAQVDYIKARVPNAEVFVHPHPGEAGAVGAAMEAMRVVQQRGESTFVGLEQAIGIEYATINTPATRCVFCENNCARTFIDSRTPDGLTARYISGFSCEKGTVEDLSALKALNAQRRQAMKRHPNLVTYEANRCFSHIYETKPLPGEEQWVDDIKVQRTFLGGVKRTPLRRRFQRTPALAAERRKGLRVAMPRCLDMWTYGPLWRAYFETLGLAPKNILWSDETREEMFAEGGKYGSVDPCYPSKVTQAHLHNLLFHHHCAERPVDFIFFPSVTDAPSFLNQITRSASCPVVTGTPNVMKAAFTKEVDFFAAREIDYVDAAVTISEPTLFKRQMFEMWGARLGVSEDESDFAIDEGWRILAEFEADLQEKGRALLERVEEEHRIAILLLCRPYHLDPGLNHGISEDFQVRGYPMLTLRAIPKSPQWLERFFAEDLERGVVESPLEIGDVWPEGYNANSAQKVWGAKFAARHPNVAILDLSSFKCGHDAPTYGIIEQIISKSNTPYSALHDIDANKPAGSINIRVQTYVASLALRQEALEGRWRGEQELATRVAAMRHAMLGEGTGSWATGGLP